MKFKLKFLPKSLKNIKYKSIKGNHWYLQRNIPNTNVSTPGYELTLITHSKNEYVNPDLVRKDVMGSGKPGRTATLDHKVFVDEYRMEELSIKKTTQTKLDSINIENMKEHWKNVMNKDMLEFDSNKVVFEVDEEGTPLTYNNSDDLDITI